MSLSHLSRCNLRHAADIRSTGSLDRFPCLHANVVLDVYERFHTFVLLRMTVLYEAAEWREASARTNHNDRHIWPVW